MYGGLGNIEKYSDGTLSQCRILDARMLGWLLLVLLTGLEMVGLAGCGRPRGQLFEEITPPLQWPRSAKKARIKYLGQLRTEDDLKREVSGWEAFRRALFGREEIGTMVAPSDVVLDNMDRLFVSDTFGSVIHRMDLIDRQYRQLSGSTEDLSVSTPVGLCIVNDNLFVTDSELGRVCVFAPDGQLVSSFGEDVLVRPVGIAYNGLVDRVYVADASRHTISIFDRHGQLTETLGQRGDDLGQFNFPTYLWVDKLGKLYVCDTLNYRIQVFSPQNEFLFTFGKQGDRPGYFDHPSGIAVDNHGNIYVIDKHFENIQIFDPQGRILMAFGKEGSKPGMFWLPGGIFIDHNNRIFVADSYNKRVQVFQLLEDEENETE